MLEKFSLQHLATVAIMGTWDAYASLWLWGLPRRTVRLASDAYSRIMVSLFFLISGYLMQLTLNVNYRQFEGAGYLKYYVNRIIRIFPLYWTVVLFVFIFDHNYFNKQTSGAVLGTLFLGLNDAGRVVGPAWTLPFELFYIAFAPIVLLLEIRAIVGVLTLYTAFKTNFEITALKDLIRPFGMGAVSGSAPVQATVIFALGAIIYKLKTYRQRNLRLPIVNKFAVNLSLIVISPIPFLILIPFSKRNDLFNQIDRFSSLLNLSLICAVIAVLGVWDHTESSISKSMGTWTYPLYLFH